VHSRALADLLNAPAERDRTNARAHARDTLASVYSLQRERGIWERGDDGTALSEFDRTMITQLIIDRFDCPWCVARAGELCVPEKGYGREVATTHLVA
jgi:hypothetical protein